ncbi:MAG: alpha/beta hydrolase family protein [Tenuifilaceae bacterium]
MRTRILNILIPIFLITSCSNAQTQQEKKDNQNNSNISGIYTSQQLESLFAKPKLLEGYQPNQKGPITKIDSNGKETTDSTFKVVKMKIPSDGFMINGWLYLPLGEGKFPLVILTNGGGDGSRAIKSLSDWIAPIFAHCGIAAFVHDKRGTGESEGDFAKTTYEDYIRDAGNCANWLSKDERINPEMLGIMGGSEGGRIAVIAANRYNEIKFVISFAGTVVSAIDDRINAQKGWLQSLNLPDSVYADVLELHEKSIKAWASNSSEEHIKVNQEIFRMRKKYDKEILPYSKNEMDSILEFRVVLPTWNSLSFDYQSELKHFNKRWLAIFGEVDRVVPTEASVKNIIYYMSLSGNKDYNIAVIPKCGHAPVNVETKRLIRMDHLAINWINENVIKKQ